MPENYTYHIACSGLAASGAVSSGISSLTVGICGVAKVSEQWTKAATIAAGGLSGGVTASMAGGSFLDGVCNGLISSGLNHAMHLVAEGGSPDDPPGKQDDRRKLMMFWQKKNPSLSWDKNGDGKLQRTEANDWWENSNGAPVYVDNSKIDWTGLKIPKGKVAGDVFSITTVEAFLNLPYETAATYGGTSFRVIDSETVSVFDQDYDFEMHNVENVSTVLRNIATAVGRPSNCGTDFSIHFYNRQIKIK